MTKIRAIIIDDEQESRNTVLNILVKYCPDVVVVAQGEDVRSGMRVILEYQPDLVFLDVQMPDGTGFDLLERLPEITFRVVFVTAYDQFALKAIKFSALDYILKPIDPQQLIEAVNKFEPPSKLKQFTDQISTLLRNKNHLERIALPTLEGYRFINVRDIIRCQSDSNYTRFFLNNGHQVLVTRTLKESDEALSDMEFVLIHQSHPINIRYIDRYLKGDGGTIIMTDGSALELARRRKEEFLARMQDWKV